MPPSASPQADRRRSDRTKRQQRSGPGRWTARTLSLALCLAGALSTPTPAAAQTPSAGKSKAGACAVCHGPVGLSTQPNAPHLAGQPEIYLVEQLKAYRSGKRPNEVMGVIARPLSDADIADLAAWYASIEIRAEPRH